MGKKVTVDLTKEERVKNYLSSNKKKKEWSEKPRSTKKRRLNTEKRQKNINYMNYDLYDEEYEYEF